MAAGKVQNMGRSASEADLTEAPHTPASAPSLTRSRSAPELTALGVDRRTPPSDPSRPQRRSSIPSRQAPEQAAAEQAGAGRAATRHTEPATEQAGVGGPATHAAVDARAAAEATQAERIAAEQEAADIISPVVAARHGHVVTGAAGSSPPAEPPGLPLGEGPVLPEVSSGHLQRMSRWVEKAIEQAQGKPLDAHVQQGVQQRIELSLRMLKAAGMPESQVEAWVQKSHKKAFWVAVGTGVLEQGGYLMGMETAVHNIKPPAWAVTNGSTLGWFLGAYVGTLDVSTTIAAGKLQQALTQLNSGGGLPEGVVQREKWGAIVNNAGWKTIDNVAKNSVRIILPFIQKEIEKRMGQTDGLIDASWCNELDVGWDGFAGLANGVIGKLRSLREDASGVPYLARLLLQPPADFANMLNSSMSPAPPVAPPGEISNDALAPPQAQTARQWAKELAIPMAVIGIVMVHIAMLISRNSNIVTDGHQDRAPELSDLKSLQRLNPTVMAARAASSTHQMAIMTFVISMLAPVFEMAVDKVVDFAVQPRMPRIQWPANLRTSLPAPPDGDG